MTIYRLAIAWARFQVRSMPGGLVLGLPFQLLLNNDGHDRLELGFAGTPMESMEACQEVITQLRAGQYRMPEQMQAICTMDSAHDLQQIQQVEEWIAGEFFREVRRRADQPPGG